MPSATERSITEHPARGGSPQARRGDGLNITDQLAAHGLLPELAAEASGPGVIDLSNASARRPRRGGRDPSVPQVLTSHRVSGPVQIGHTRSYADESEPIIVRAADTMWPGADGTAFTDGRCRSCVAHMTIARGDGDTLLVIEHEAGCREMAALLRQAGVARS